MTRLLSHEFMNDLGDDGFLHPLLQRILEDRDLDLHIRLDDAINVYFKGNSLLYLKRNSADGSYFSEIAPEFDPMGEIPHQVNANDVEILLRQFPILKDRISRHTQNLTEAEIEQLIIRAANYSTGINSDHFILDRQYGRSGWSRSRIDLVGICWPWAGRAAHQLVSLSVFELKESLNNDIQSISSQLETYRNLVSRELPDIAKEMAGILQQKLDLGLFDHAHATRAGAMRTLKINTDPMSVQYNVILNNYNPYSDLLDRAIPSLRDLPFSNQVRVYMAGNGLWSVRATHPLPVVGQE